ncbi:hypothetical protein O0L34_g9422 [Tuta absoluta]|nr:hypothetical protein O0L34_g9422 [Tuta absoluta]
MLNILSGPCSLNSINLSMESIYLIGLPIWFFFFSVCLILQKQLGFRQKLPKTVAASPGRRVNDPRDRNPNNVYDLKISGGGLMWQSVYRKQARPPKTLILSRSSWY